MDVVEDLVLGKRLDHRVHQDIHLIDPNEIFHFFRLIQSQAQFGPPSAKSLKNDPQVFARMILERFGEVLPGGVGDLHGVGPPSRVLKDEGIAEQ